MLPFSNTNNNSFGNGPRESNSNNTRIMTARPISSGLNSKYNENNENLYRAKSRTITKAPGTSRKERALGNILNSTKKTGTGLSSARKSKTGLINKRKTQGGLFSSTTHKPSTINILKDNENENENENEIEFSSSKFYLNGGPPVPTYDPWPELEEISAKIDKSSTNIIIEPPMPCEVNILDDDLNLNSFNSGVEDLILPTEKVDIFSLEDLTL